MRRRPSGPIGLAALALCLYAPACDNAPLRAAPPPRPRLGMNLSGVVDYSTEQPFADVFRASRAWISQKDGAPWGHGPKLDLDAHGWVRRLEPGCYAETLLCTIDGGHYPGGDYVVTYRGRGRVTLSGAASVVHARPNRLTARVDPQRGGMFLQVRETDPSDPVREIRVFLPGTEPAAAGNPWNPEFLDRWQGVACLRFMDFMATNNSEVVSWADRPKPDDASYATRGVPVELMVDLANRLGADAWFCMPHKADDGYVREFAKVVRDRLHPGRKAYVEYSNEVWNGSFSQSRHAGERGQALGFGDKPWEAGWRYTAHRSVQIFKIWEDVFGGRDRLVRVLASQAANPYVAEQVVSFQKAYEHADALAIAPYLGLTVTPDGKPSASEVAGWTTDRVFDHLGRVVLPEAVGWVRGNKRVADRYGLALVAYEGGQHMVGANGAENNDRLTRLFHAANADPRMEPLYARYFEAWVKEGGGLFCYFASTGAWSKWGSWGVTQYLDEDPIGVPKYRAVMRWAKSLGQPVNAP